MNDRLEDLDRALMAMRPLWSPPTSGRRPAHAVSAPDLSSVLVVQAIAEQEGRCGVQDVADSLAVAPATASRLCDRAAERGYVDRGRDPHDPRRAALSLTRAGMALRSEALAHRTAYLAELTSAWEPEDVAAFARLTARFAEEVRRRPPRSAGTTG